MSKLPAKIGKFDLLPPQTVLAFNAKLAPLKGDKDSKLEGQGSESPASPDPPQKSTSVLEMVQGGQAPVPKTYVEPSQNLSEEDAKKHAFMAKCREIEFSRIREDEFFGQADIVKSLGSSKIKVRLGFSNYHEAFMIYTGKRNQDPAIQTSVLEISLSEVDDIVANLEKLIEEIQTGLDNKQPLYHPENIKEYKVPSAEYLDFWFDSSTYYSASGNIRARFVWQPINVYSCTINHVKKSVKHPNSFGPRIRFNMIEIKEYVQVLKKMKAELPEESANSF